MLEVVGSRGSVSRSGLADYERAAQRVLFSLQVSQQDLDLLGVSERWLLYRRMARDRLFNMLEAGLPRTRRALGTEAFGRSFDRWLDEAPPRTRYIREILDGFLQSAAPSWTTDHPSKPWLSDLAAYEHARWQVGYEEGPPTPLPVADFAFDRLPQVNPVLRVLELEHPVHEKRSEGNWSCRRTHLCVYRRPDTLKPDTWLLNAMAAALLREWQRPERTVAESVRLVAEARGVRIDESFIAKLSDMLAAFIQRGILLGSRP